MRMDMSVRHTGRSDRMSNPKGSRRSFANKRREVSGDTMEMIQRCLSCSRPECVNCYVTSKRRKRGLDMRKRPLEFQDKFLDAYIIASDDTEIGGILHKSQATVCKYRMGLNFPPPSRVSAGERKRMVNEWRLRSG